MTHNEKVLELLSDGQPHTHHEIYGLYVVGHSRIADLRKRGHVIEAWREGDDYLYQLKDSAPAIGPLTRPSSSIPLEPGGSQWASTGAEQLPLITGYNIREGSQILADRYAA